MGAVAPIVAAFTAFGDELKKGFEDVTGISGQKKIASDARNQQMQAAADAEAALKEQQTQQAATLTQKKRRATVSSMSSQKGDTGRGGTVLGSGLSSAPTADLQQKTLLGQ